MGLDRHPNLRDIYFKHYTKLVYQAQTDDAFWEPSTLLQELAGKGQGFS